MRRDQVILGDHHDHIDGKAKYVCPSDSYTHMHHHI